METHEKGHRPQDGRLRLGRSCVIGGAGFIGKYVVEILLSRKRDVTVVDRMDPQLAFPGRIRYLCGDYSDDGFLAKALEGSDEIIDLAYTTVPKTSYDDPVHDISSSLPPAVKLFSTASGLPIKKLVVVSSGGTVYGQANTLPIREDHPTNPISPYGITKLAIEKYALMYHHLNRLPVVCVRPSNAYGEGQKAFTGQGFVATAIANILKEQDVVIYGESGTIRDYIYVRDVAKGIVAALERGVPGSCYNVGTGVGKSNRDVLDAISSHAASLGFRARLHVLPSRHFDVSANVLDSSKLSEETGWKPLTSFDDGIRRTWDWYHDVFKMARSLRGNETSI